MTWHKTTATSLPGLQCTAIKEQSSRACENGILGVGPIDGTCIPGSNDAEEEMGNAAPFDFKVL